MLAEGGREGDVGRGDCFETGKCEVSCLSVVMSIDGREEGRHTNKKLTPASPAADASALVTLLAL